MLEKHPNARRTSITPTSRPRSGSAKELWATHPGRGLQLRAPRPCTQAGPFIQRASARSCVGPPACCGPPGQSACHPSNPVRSLFQDRTPNLTAWETRSNCKRQSGTVVLALLAGGRNLVSGLKIRLIAGLSIGLMKDTNWTY